MSSDRVISRGPESVGESTLDMPELLEKSLGPDQFPRGWHGSPNVFGSKTEIGTASDTVLLSVQGSKDGDSQSLQVSRDMSQSFGGTESIKTRSSQQTTRAASTRAAMSGGSRSIRSPKSILQLEEVGSSVPRGGRTSGMESVIVSHQEGEAF